jgi:hypothetical protein
MTVILKFLVQMPTNRATATCTNEATMKKEEANLRET